MNQAKEPDAGMVVWRIWCESCRGGGMLCNPDYTSATCEPCKGNGFRTVADPERSQRDDRVREIDRAFRCGVTQERERVRSAVTSLLALLAPLVVAGCGGPPSSAPPAEVAELGAPVPTGDVRPWESPPSATDVRGRFELDGQRIRDRRTGLVWHRRGLSAFDSPSARADRAAVCAASSPTLQPASVAEILGIVELAPEGGVWRLPDGFIVATTVSGAASDGCVDYLEGTSGPIDSCKGQTVQVLCRETRP